MSISVTDTINTYIGNNSTSTIYPITYKYYDNDHVKVFADNVDITSEVAFTGDGTDNTGGFTTATAYASSVALIAVLDMPMDQPTVLLEAGRLPAKVIEQAGFDRLNMQTRTVLRQLAQTITFDPSTVPFTSLVVRPNTIVGIDENNDTILVDQALLTEIGAIDQAVIDAQAAQAGAEAAEAGAEAAEAAAAISEANAANSAISAKGFITISALDQTDIPTAYPVDQASVMAVDTTAPGGTWDHEGMVFTHVFTDSGFATSYEQIYVPASTTSGKFIQVRYGLTSGSTWSTWGQWTDALSKSLGGTVTGDVEFSGKLTSTGSTSPSTDNTIVQGVKDTDLRALPENIYHPRIEDLTFTVTAGGTATKEEFDRVALATLSQGDKTHVKFAKNIGRSSINRNYDTKPFNNAGSERDLVLGLTLSNNTGNGNDYRVTAIQDGNLTTELTTALEGFQFIFSVSDVSTQRVKILTSYSSTLQDSGWQNVNWTQGTASYEDNLRCILGHDGSMTMWRQEEGEEFTLLYTAPFTHPWVDGVYSQFASLKYSYATFTKDSVVGTGGTHYLSNLYYAKINN